MKYMWCNCAEGLENVVFNYFTWRRGERGDNKGKGSVVLCLREKSSFAITAPLREEFLEEVS